MTAAGGILWARGFRPFFLLASGYAIALLGVWIAVLFGALPAPGWLGPSAWHAHEMLFGFVAAAIAGFLLTSVPVWTGAAPVVGVRLMALAALWLAGRVAFALAGALPPLVVALADLAFLPALGVAIGAPLFAVRQPRNYGFAALVAGLAVANLSVHLEAFGLRPLGAGAGVRAAVFLVALLVAIVGGRITPAFTRNALRRSGVAAELRSRRALELFALGSIALVLATDLLAPRSAASGSAALLAAFAQFARLSGWQTRRVLGDPLLWSLHMGYAWLGIGFGLLAASDLAGWLSWTSGIHALTAGGFGATILAVMSRVALGHTGRPLVAPPGMLLAYLAVNLGAALRVAAALLAPEWQLAALACAALAWAAAFALFLGLYLPILAQPRIDGAAG